MNLKGHDNYQEVHVKGKKITGGARSTRRLNLIRWDAFEDKRVLDIGCNSGMLAIHAKKMGAEYVVGVDKGDVLHVAEEAAKAQGLQIYFKHMDMESQELVDLALTGNFDIVFFCAMLNHVRPENRATYLQFLDHITNEILIFETNFEGKPEKYLPIVKKYTTFDNVMDLGLSGDRKPDDYHIYQFERHRNEPYEVKGLPVLTVPIGSVQCASSAYQFQGEQLANHKRRLAAMVESLETNGQVRPCLALPIDEPPYSWRLREGTHRHLGLQKINSPTIKIRDVTDVPMKVLRKDV